MLHYLSSSSIPTFIIKQKITNYKLTILYIQQVLSKAAIKQGINNVNEFIKIKQSNEDIEYFKRELKKKYLFIQLHRD